MHILKKYIKEILQTEAVASGYNAVGFHEMTTFYRNANQADTDYFEDLLKDDLTTDAMEFLNQWLENQGHERLDKYSNLEVDKYSNLEEFSIQADQKNMHLDGSSKMGSYTSPKDTTWLGDDTDKHIVNWYKLMGLMR